MGIRDKIRSLLFTPFTSADELWRKRSAWGEINEFFNRQVFTSDDAGYNPPLLGNPLNEHFQQANWATRVDDHYDYLEPERAERADRLFEFVHGMIKDRVSKDDVLLDVGCNTGYQMDNFHKKGFTNVWGIDPMTHAIETGREKRPHLNFVNGYFGDPKNDVSCDILVCFGSVFRIPYSTRLFDAIDRCTSKYVMMWLQEAVDDFNRDPHIGLAKRGFICIEKRVVQRDTYIPIGLPDTDGPMLTIRDREEGIPSRRNFSSFFLFRRLEPRPPAQKAPRHQVAP